MAINVDDLLPLGRNGQVFKIKVEDLTEHQKDTFVEIGGDTMEGALRLLPPITGDDGANKTYVDSEIKKVVDQLDDIVSQRQEGIYAYKSPGFNGSSPRPPGNGEFYIFRNQSLDFTPTYEVADRLWISHTSSDTSVNNLADIKVGEYMQFNISGSADSFTYIVETISQRVGYTEFDITFNRKSSSSVVSPSDGEVSRLQTYHIEGIDVDDLNTSLDTRYVSTDGDIVSGAIALGDTTIRSGGALRVLADGPNGTLRALNYVEAGYVDITDPSGEGVKLNAFGELMIQRESTDPDTSVVMDIRKGTTQTLKITLDGNTSFGGTVRFDFDKYQELKR